MYNLIPNYDKKNFTLYHNLKAETEIQPAEIPFIKHNLNIRYLEGFKELFIYHFLKAGFRPLMLDEDFNINTFKVIASETETFYFQYCIDNPKTQFYLKNIETQFQKLPNTATLEYILELETEAQKMGFEGVTAGGAVRHYWKKNYKGWFYTKYKFNTIDINDEDLRIIDYSLRGGLCLINKFYQNKLLKNTYSIDVNSLYPYIALSSVLPYDKPIYINYLDNEDLKTAEKTHFKYKTCIYKIEFLKAKIKSKNMAWLGFRDANSTIYPPNLRCITYVWDFELKRILEDYDVKEYKILGALCFKVRKGLFDDIFDNLKNLKETTEKGSVKNRLAKQYLNSFLGKFATKRTRSYDTFKLGEDDNVYIASTEAQTSNEYYLPLFSYITAKARVFMASYINDIIGKENFIYCDTDSITCFKCAGLNAIELDNKKFGFFKLESINELAIFKKPKFYAKQTTDGEIKNVLAGINSEEIILTCEELKKGKNLYVKRLVKPSKSSEFPYMQYFKIYV